MPVTSDTVGISSIHGGEDVKVITHSIAAGEIVRYLGRHGSSRIARMVLIGTTTPFLLKSEDNPNGLVHGDRDASAPLALTGKVTAELIPDCRLEVYQGAPHGLMYTHMDRLHRDILQFIRE